MLLLHYILQRAKSCSLTTRRSQWSILQPKGLRLPISCEYSSPPNPDTECSSQVAQLRPLGPTSKFHLSRRGITYWVAPLMHNISQNWDLVLRSTSLSSNHTFRKSDSSSPFSSQLRRYITRSNSQVSATPWARSSNSISSEPCPQLPQTGRVTSSRTSTRQKWRSSLTK